jgi:hypothetical protein
MMGYWADTGYPNLVVGGSSGDYHMTIIRLNNLMGTFCEGDAGATYSQQISPAMMAYTQERGYTFRSDWLWFAPAYSQYVSEIDASRPIQVELTNSRGDQHHPTYGNHSVTGVGYEYDPSNASYQYMIIHDNWVTYERWLQFGVNYDAISFNTLVPLPYKLYLPAILKNASQ